jgi:hypothetical protein
MNFLIQILINVLLDIAAGQVTGTGSVTGAVIGGAEYAVLLLLGLPEINIVRRFAGDVILNELEKAGHEAAQQHDEDDQETARRQRALARQNPNTTFVYGEVSVEDLELVALAVPIAFIPAVTETPYYWATDLAFQITGFRG